MRIDPALSLSQVAVIRLTSDWLNAHPTKAWTASNVYPCLLYAGTTPYAISTDPS